MNTTVVCSVQLLLAGGSTVFGRQVWSRWNMSEAQFAPNLHLVKLESHILGSVQIKHIRGVVVV